MGFHCASVRSTESNPQVVGLLKMSVSVARLHHIPSSGFQFTWLWLNQSIYIYIKKRIIQVQFLKDCQMTDTWFHWHCMFDPYRKRCVYSFVFFFNIHIHIHICIYIYMHFVIYYRNITGPTIFQVPIETSCKPADWVLTSVLLEHHPNIGRLPRNEARDI